MLAQQLEHLFARGFQRRRVLGQLGDGEAGQAVLARAQHLALAAQAEVDLGELEAVALPLHRLQPLARQRPGVFGEEQAAGGVLAAADPAAQLVQLRDAVALGPLDHHHGRVGHVDADLDHRRRDEHVGRAGGEGLHRRRLVGRAHLAVDHADAEVAQLAGREPLGLDLGGPALHFLRLLDQRADDEGLPALAQLARG